MLSFFPSLYSISLMLAWKVLAFVFCFSQGSFHECFLFETWLVCLLFFLICCYQRHCARLMISLCGSRQVQMDVEMLDALSKPLEVNWIGPGSGRRFLSFEWWGGSEGCATVGFLVKSTGNSERKHTFWTICWYIYIYCCVETTSLVESIWNPSQMGGFSMLTSAQFLS